MTVIIHGPMGCGKTTHAEQFRQLFRCNRIVDDIWKDWHLLRTHDLALTTVPPPYPPLNPKSKTVSIFTFHQAMELLRTHNR